MQPWLVIRGKAMLKSVGSKQITGPTGALLCYSAGCAHRCKCICFYAVLILQTHPYAHTHTHTFLLSFKLTTTDWTLPPLGMDSHSCCNLIQLLPASLTCTTEFNSHTHVLKTMTPTHCIHTHTAEHHLQDHMSDSAFVQAVHTHTRPRTHTPETRCKQACYPADVFSVTLHILLLVDQLCVCVCFYFCED